jgi:hypothetical protein
VAAQGDGRARPEVDERGSRILGVSGGGGPGRAVAVALVSTAVFVAVAGLAITRSPGWEEVKTTFFDWGVFRD